MKRYRPAYRLTQLQMREIERLARDGKLNSEISDRTGATVLQVRHYRAEAGLTRIDHPKSERGYTNPLTANANQ